MLALLRGAGPAIAFAWRYRADLMAFGRALYTLYETLQKKVDKGNRDEKVDRGLGIRNPDELEKSFRDGGGGT